MGSRYPFVATEILSSEIKEIVDCFVVTEAPKSDMIDVSSDYPDNICKNEVNASTLLADPKDLSTEEKEVTTIEAEEIKSSIFLHQPSPSVTLATSVIFSSEAHFPLLEKLLSFLCPDHEPNPVLAGYVCKIFATVLEKKRTEIWKYLHVNKQHMTNLIKHCGNTSIAELVGKLLGNYYCETVDEAFLVQRKEIMRRLIDGSDKCPLEFKWDAINTLINSRTELAFFLGEDVIKTVYYIACEDARNLKPGLKLLKSLLKADSNESDKGDANKLNTPPESGITPILRNK